MQLAILRKLKTDEIKEYNKRILMHCFFSDTKDSNASSKDLFIDCSTAHFNKAKSFEALVQSLLNQEKSWDVFFTRPLKDLTKSLKLKCVTLTNKKNKSYHVNFKLII